MEEIKKIILENEEVDEYNELNNKFENAVKERITIEKIGQNKWWFMLLGFIIGTIFITVISWS